jgi:hypothetical protein
LEVCTQSYGPPKSRESQLWEFQVFHLGVPGHNNIWMLGPWPGAKIYYEGEGGGFLQVWAMVNFVSPCLLMAH